MDITLKDKSVENLQIKADQIPADKVALVSSKTSPGPIKINGVQDHNYPDLTHTDLAISQKVFDWISSTFDWFR
jgi:hypothetical protein